RCCSLEQFFRAFHRHGRQADSRGDRHRAPAIQGAVMIEQLTRAAQDVLAERRRQIEIEGWTSEHDDGHVNDEIAAMACFYAMPPGARKWSAGAFGEVIIPEGWVAKEGDRRSELVKAGALILAEIERLDRQQSREAVHDQ